MSGVLTHRILAAVAVLLAVSAAFVGTSSRSTTGSVDVASLAQQIEREDDHVTALELAQWIKDRKPGLRVLDIRADSEFEAYHIPSAERVPLTEIAKMTPKGDQTLVLYSEGGAHAAQGWVLLRSIGFTNVYFLRGGLLDWMEDIVNPMLPEVSGNAKTDSARTAHAALSRYFGGVPRLGAVPLPAPTSAAQAVARVRRRGC
ncbi:MAG: Rhodanese-like protein [Gemmatimonadetes bacterium]|nr:Rhodanese-like protein [Gemmatimonadota bacterium]